MKEKPKSRIYRVSEIAPAAIKNKKEIYVKGFDCGFKTGDDIISYRKGFSTGIYSYSAQGKTQFYIQEAVHLSIAHGWKHAIWLTENGKKQELITDIAMTVMGKSIFSGNHIVTDEDLEQVFAWMDNYFFIIDHEEDILSIRDIFSIVTDYEKENGVKFDGIAIDNASNLAKGVETARMDTKDYMNYLMRAINRTSSKKDYHTFILFHVNPPSEITCPDSGISYMPCPTHYMISGGQQINYLGYQLVCIWRPINKEDKVGVINPKTGIPYRINETRVEVTKTKPKAVGRVDGFSIYFDTDIQRYYEEVDDMVYYCGEYFNQHGGLTAELQALAPVIKDQEDLFSPVKRIQPKPVDVASDTLAAHLNPSAGITPSNDFEF